MAGDQSGLRSNKPQKLTLSLEIVNSAGTPNAKSYQKMNHCANFERLQANSTKRVLPSITAITKLRRTTYLWAAVQHM